LRPLANLGHCARLARAAFVLAREGAFADIDRQVVPPLARAPLALANLVARRGAKGIDGLSAAIARLGPSYVKLGQFLSTRPDIVGAKVAEQLEQLQDRMTPYPRSIAVATIEAAFGKKLDALFIDFSEAVAAASIAQVHRARVKDGDATREVAVKILRPGVERRFARDLSDMFFAARLAQRMAPEMRRLKPVEIVEALARSVRIEMDFRLEAAAASEFAENVHDDADFRVPKVDWDRTTREVLTLEWIHGLPLSDPDRLAGAGFDPAKLGRTLIQSFLRHALRDGLFHADMHQGNLFIDPQGRIAAVDFGIMGRLGLKERRFLAEILYGFITRDYQRVAEVHFEAGYVPPIHRVEDFAQAIRAIGEPIRSHTADQISMAKLLTLLFEITALFDMATRIELVMLQKTMVVVEGVARKLDPRLDMWATAEPVVGDWIAQNLGPRGKVEDVGRNVSSLVKLIADAPQRLERLNRLVERWEEAAEARQTPSFGGLEATGPRGGRRPALLPTALWAIAALLAWIAYRM
jgi:ubiquinone biosynthesis protein